MWEAGNTYDVPPLRLSVQGTRHQLDNFIPELTVADTQKRRRLYQTLLEQIVHKPVPERPQTL